MRETTEPTLNAHGDEIHPAFGQIQAARTSNTPGAVLFDSDIRHQHTVVIRISTATRKRDLNHDWIHGGKQLIEVELSEAQWASFVSSMNTSGVPCTLRATEGNWNVPELTYDPRLAHSMAEVKGAADTLFGEANEALAAYEQALADKAPAKVRNEALRKLHFTLKNSEPNLSYVAKTMAAHAENVVQKARADIEAMVGAEAQRLGLTQGEAQGLLELPMLAGEEPASSEFDVPPVDGCCLNLDNFLVHDPDECPVARRSAGQSALPQRCSCDPQLDDGAPDPLCVVHGGPVDTEVEA